jgi:hypothetical protein
MDRSETSDRGGVVAEDFLEHFGTKGMRWGVRRSRAERAAAANEPSEITVKTKAGKGVVKTSGGAKHPASEDAVRAAVAKQKLKKSTVDSLSNAELKSLNERLNLQATYLGNIKKLEESKEGKKFLKDLLRKEGKSFLSKEAGPSETLAKKGIAVRAAVIATKKAAKSTS